MDAHGFKRHYALLVVLLLLAGLVAGMVLAPVPGVRNAITSGMNLLAPLVALACILPAARMAPIRGDRFAWACIGLSVLAFFVSYTYWLVNAALSFHLPTLIGELLGLASYIFLWIGLLMRSGEYPHDAPGKLILICDLLIALAAAVTIAVHLVLLDNLVERGVNLPLRLHFFMFPFIVLITLVSIIVLLFRATSREQHGPRAVLVLGIGIVLSAYSWLTYQMLTGRNPMGVWQQLLWPTGFLLYGGAALWEARYFRRAAGRVREIDPFPSLVGLMVSVVLVLVALALSIRSCLGQPRVDNRRVLFLLFSLAVLITLTMIRQIITFVSNRQLYQALRRLYAEMARNAATDPLTGLANHRYFTSRLNREVHRSMRYQRSLALIFADLDHFKQINDTYGHNIGDQALIAVANCLQANVRESDVVARYGGEEFVVLLPETTLEQAQLLGERLRRAISQIDLPLSQGAMRRLTLSCGVSAFPDTANSAENLLATADQAMYRAKQSGRNQVVVSEPSAHAVAIGEM